MPRRISALRRIILQPGGAQVKNATCACPRRPRPIARDPEVLIVKVVFVPILLQVVPGRLLEARGEAEVKLEGATSAATQHFRYQLFQRFHITFVADYQRLRSFSLPGFAVITQSIASF